MTDLQMLDTYGYTNVSSEVGMSYNGSLLEKAAKAAGR